MTYKPPVLSKRRQARLARKHARFCGDNELRTMLKRAGATPEEIEGVLNSKNPAEKHAKLSRVVSKYREESRSRTKKESIIMLFRAGKKPSEIKRVLKGTSPEFIDRCYKEYLLKQ